ncbi:MAG: hypothetical protein F2806_09405, partial [Actinobacteria bacterium]|nr:hypothetical protein [Actinomycetota bacterium]
MSASLKVVIQQRLPDIASVTGIWIAVTLLTQRWAGLDTPDSSFYTSLGLFGSEVSDRAFDNSYFWTRLGAITPTHLLTSVFGTWTGFAIWHALLLLLFIVGAYVAIRTFTSAPIAAVLTACISFSSVPLSYLANPYLTGAVLAGTSALIATALFQSNKAAITAGVILGWLVMVNPPGVLLAGVVWLVVKFQRKYQIKQTPSALTRNIATAAITTILTFIAFLGIGKIIFPELNWFSAYLDAQGINLSDFASKDPVWLQDISLLVPLSILVFTAILWFAKKSNHAAQLGFAISASCIGFMLVFSPLMGGIALEAPMYQAMLWPPALIGLALSITATIPMARTRWSGTQIIAAAAAIGIIVIAGHWSGSVGLLAGQLLVILLIAAAAVLTLTRKPKYALHAALAAVCILVAGGQLLQNSRGPLGLYYLSPYNWAFNSNPISEKLHAAVNTQEWLLANTEDSDTILTWVQGDWVNGDRELYVVAGMQLW